MTNGRKFPCGVGQLMFTNNTVLVVDSAEKLNGLLYMFHKAYDKGKLKINVTKSKIV